MIEHGQITPETALGKMLIRLARDAESIVETGTWNGHGSTQCLRAGLIRSTQRLWSVETNEAKHCTAKIVHADEPRIKLLLGTIVKGEELGPFKCAFKGHQKKGREASQGYAWEVLQNDTSPYVFDQLPPKIDLLLIDGGEWSGFAEVKKLYDRCKIIALDDTRTKNNQSREFLLHNGWELIADNPSDRNGWCILKRKS